MPSYLSIGPAAEILGVSINTIRNWEKEGKIKSYRSKGNHRLFIREELEVLKRSLPLSTKEVASLLSVSPSQVRRLAINGSLEFNIDKNGRRSFSRNTIEDFIKNPSGVRPSATPRVAPVHKEVVSTKDSKEVNKAKESQEASLLESLIAGNMNAKAKNRRNDEAITAVGRLRSPYNEDLPDKGESSAEPIGDQNNPNITGRASIPPTDPVLSSSVEAASKYQVREFTPSVLPPRTGAVKQPSKLRAKGYALRTASIATILILAVYTSAQFGARISGKVESVSEWMKSSSDIDSGTSRLADLSLQGDPRVLALRAQDLQRFMEVNVPAIFNDQVSIDGLLHLQNNVEAPGQNINLGSGTITASNLVNSIQGQTGDLSLQAGSGIAIDGLTISATATATGEEQDALKRIKVGNDTFTASDPNAVLTVLGSGNTSLSLNKNTGTLTISTTDEDTDTTYTAGSDLALSGTEFSLASTLNSVSVINLSGTGKITGLDEVDTASEDTIEALVFDADAATVAGAWTVADAVPFSVGTGGLSVTGETTFNGVSYTWPNADGEANQVLTTDASGNLSWESSLGGGSGDVTAVGDCVSGNCFDGTSDGGTYISFYDAQGAGQLITGNLTQARTWTLPDLTGTVILSGHALTGDVIATLDSSGSTSSTVAKINGATLGSTTATSGNVLVADGSQWVSVNPSGDVDIASGGIMTIQADSVEVSMLLDDGNPPSDEHCLTYEATGGTFAWQDCNSTGFTSFDITDDDIGAETETVENGETITFADGSGIDVDVTATNTVAVALNHLGIQNLMDPGNDRMFFWDESDNAAAWLAPDGTIIQISGTTLQIADDSIDGDKLADTITLDANLSFQDADTNTLLTLSDAGTTGNLSISGDLTVTGGDITLGTTSILSGGDTASLNNIDAINATTENTLEGALDIGGDVTGTGLTAVTVAKINGATLGTTTATGGNLLIGDGDSWESVSMSGDAAIAANGALTVTADAIDGDELADAITLDSSTLVFDDGTNTLLTLTDDGTTGSLAMTGGLTVGTTTTLGGGTYTWPVNDGDADQVLTSNGSGTLSWTAVSGLASGDITAVGTCDSGACFTESDPSAYSLYFEGATDDEFEIILAAEDATSSDKTITLPNTTGTVILSGHTFTGDVTGTVDSDGSTALSIAADVVDGDELADAITLDSATLVFDDGTNTLLTLTDDGTTGSLNMTGALTVGTTTTLGGGTYTWPGDDGNADQVLVSNGSGTLSWQDVGGVGAGDGDITAVGTCSDGACFTAADTAEYSLYFEGSADDSYEVILTAANATSSDKTITLPNATGTVILSGHTFTGDATGTLDTDGSTALTVASINGATLGTTTATSGNLLIGDGDSWESAVLGGDATIAANGTLTIASDAIEESMLKAVNSATDEYCLTYETTTGDFEWQDCNSGGLMSSFIISDDETVPTTQTINDGETVTYSDTSTIDLAVAAVNSISASVVADSLNYAELSDALSLDASTALALGTYDYDINVNSSGVFAIQDAGSDVFKVDANGKITIYDETDFSLAAGEDINISATSAPTTDVLVLSNNGFGTTTNGVDGLYVDFTATSDAASGDTNAAVNISATASGDSGDSLYGLNIASTGISAGTLYGINIPGITGGAGTEYGLVIGTGWDKGMYVQSAAEFTSSLTVDSTTLVVNASGYEDKVGIGTATPGEALHVKNGNSLLENNDHISLTIRSTAGTTNRSQGIYFEHTIDNTDSFLLTRDNSNNFALQRSDAQPFASADTTVWQYRDGTNDFQILDGNYTFDTDAATFSEPLVISPGSAEGITIRSNGTINYTNYITYENTADNADSWRLGRLTNNDFALEYSATQPFGTPTEIMHYATSGYVGIANTNPGALLDLGTAGTTLGTMRLEGSTSGYVQIQPAVAAGSWTLTLPSTDGDANQFLQTNGSGTATWASADNYSSWTIQDGDTTTYSVTSGDTLQLAEGTAMDVNGTADDVITISHLTGNGYSHVPSGGASTQILQYSSAGTAKWVTASGDIAIADNGAVTIQNNAVTLGTDTSGNYVATIADAGNGNITVANSGTETAAVTLDITADSLDFTELEDTLDLDAALVVNQATNTWTQNFTGTTTTGLTLNADSLTTGTALQLASTSTDGGASGSSKMLDLTRSGTNSSASHTAYGVYSSVVNTGTTSTNIGGYFSASGATSNHGIIVENGNVGIGTTAPSELLEVVNPTHVANVLIKGEGGTGDTRAELIIDRTGGARGGGIRIKASAADPALDEWWIGVPYLSGNISDKFTIGHDATLAQRSTSALFTIMDTGNVGIGDGTPDQLLEVLSSGAANTQFSIGNINAGDYDAQIGFELANGTNTFTMGVDDSDSDKFKISTTALGTNDRFVIDSTGNTTLAGDLTISGDDLTMGTNTAGYMLVADGTNYNPVAVSGDATLSSAGALTIASNAVTLGTDTSGNYVATIADAGNGNITVANSGTETAGVTLDITADSLDFTELEDTLDLDAALTINTSGNDIVWNEDGADSDFRIEGDTEANLVFVDAGADKVGIGTNTPSEMLSVVNTAGVANILIKGEVGLGHTRSELIIDRDSDVRGGGMRIQATNVANTYNGEWWVGAPYFSGNSHGRFSIAYHDTDADNVTSGMFQVWSGGKVEIGNVDLTGTPSTSVGAFLYVSDRVFTDINTAASGTASGIVFNSFNTPTLAADNTGVTTTNATNVYIQSAPTAGTNQTITNAYALWVDAGNARFDGQVDAGTYGDGLVTKVNAGACSDSTFTTDTDGTICVDSSNGRLYFRYGGAWHYTAQTAGFQIPNLVRNGQNETEGLNPGDYVIGKLDERMSDGALHGVYVSINELIPDLDFFANTDDKLSLLEMRLSDVEERISANSDLSGTTSTSTSPSKDEEVLFLQDADNPTNLLFAKDLTLQGLLSVYDDAVFESQLTVKSDVTMYASLVVDSVHIANALNVHGDTNLLGNLTVEKDAQVKGELSISGRQAGTAKIPRGGQEVKVEFEQPLVYTPVVQVSLHGDAQDVKYAVNNVTQTGFTLSLSAISRREVSFSWLAISAENPVTVTGVVVDDNNNGIPDIDEAGDISTTPTASPEQSESSGESEEDSLPKPQSTPSPSPSPTTLVPSPTASPSGVSSPSPQQSSVPQLSPQNSVPIP